MSENDHKPEPAATSPGNQLDPFEVLAQPEGPAQYGLRGLLALQLVVALYVAGLVAFGAWMIPPLFVATILSRVGPFRLRNPALRRIVFGLLAGVALPLLGLCYEGDFADGVKPFSVFTTFRTFDAWFWSALIGIQMVALVAWLVLDATVGRPSSLLSGALTVGACIACLWLILRGMDTTFAVGLFLPTLATWTYADNASRAEGRQARLRPGRHFVLYVTGFALAIGLPWLICKVLGLE
ncbi:MAG: hypothetical protein JW818_15290 [Pirellulales bacterium]|nr:hypothetical protein [Pirellulales bacterium]